MASKRITQETFDAAVRENIEEFDMGPEEAVKEAVEQFESQGRAAWLCPSASLALCPIATSSPQLLTYRSDVLPWLCRACVAALDLSLLCTLPWIGWWSSPT